MMNGRVFCRSAVMKWEVSKGICRVTRISCLLLYDFQLSGSCLETSINSHDPTLRLLLPMETHRVWLQQTSHSLLIPEVCVLCWEHLKCQSWFIPNDSKCVFLSMFYCSLIFLSILIKYFSRCFLRFDTGVWWHSVFANKVNKHHNCVLVIYQTLSYPKWLTVYLLRVQSPWSDLRLSALPHL